MARQVRAFYNREQYEEYIRHRGVLETEIYTYNECGRLVIEYPMIGKKYSKESMVADMIGTVIGDATMLGFMGINFGDEREVREFDFYYSLEPLGDRKESIVVVEYVGFDSQYGKSGHTSKEEENAFALFSIADENPMDGLIRMAKIIIPKENVVELKLAMKSE